MIIQKLPPLMHAHQLAVTQLPGHRSRVVGIALDDGDHGAYLVAVVLCARSERCTKCDTWIARYGHVELGVIIKSKVEVDRVTEPPAPAATEEFPL